MSVSMRNSLKLHKINGHFHINILQKKKDGSANWGSLRAQLTPFIFIFEQKRSELGSKLGCTWQHMRNVG